MTRPLITMATVLLCLAAPACLGRQAGSPPDTGSRIASLRATTVQSLPVYPDTMSSPRLVAWSEGIGQEQITKLALCRSSGDCSWRRSWPDAFDPALHAMDAWSTATSRVFLMTIQYGAAAETMMILGVPRVGRPVVLDTRDAALIWIDPRDSVVHVDDAESGPAAMECLDWSPAAQALRTIPCPNAGTR